MKITQISLALFAIALAGCGSNNSDQTPTAPATVDSAPAMTDNSATASTSAPAMSSDKTSGDKTSDTATNAPAMANDKMANSKMSDMNMKPAATDKSDYYRVRGQVAEVTPAGTSSAASMMIKHEDIPGFMKAMTMRVPLANAADAGKIKAGDKIAFEMKKGNTQVSNIEQLPPATALKLAP